MSICGIYVILCTVSGKRYVGSSANIPQRWAAHRGALRAGTHTSPRLQKAWNKHGEGNFTFAVLEYCEIKELFSREQHHIDALKPDYNSMRQVRVISKEMREKMTAQLRARANLITHCPRGHEYDAGNTYRNKKGKRICRACNSMRVSSIYQNETAEQREQRRERLAAYFLANKESRRAQMLQYRIAHLEEKRAYDAARRKRMAEQV